MAREMVDTVLEETIAVEEPGTGVGAPREQSLMTLLALVEGDILTYLEAQGRVPLRHLIQAMDWPSRMVLMAVGALIRKGLLAGRQQLLEVMVELTPEGRSASPEPVGSPVTT
jgi:hypothetical protein